MRGFDSATNDTCGFNPSARRFPRASRMTIRETLTGLSELGAREPPRALPLPTDGSAAAATQAVAVLQVTSAVATAEAAETAETAVVNNRSRQRVRMMIV